jgi:DNA-binding response OmpR family regulator
VRFRPHCPTILLVSDRRSARHEHADHLRAAGYTVHMADARRTAMVILRDVDPSLTVIDLPPYEGARLVDEARSLDPEAPVLVAEGLAQSDLLRAVEDLRRRDEERPPAA